MASGDDFICNQCGNEWMFFKAMRHHLFPTNPTCPKCGSDDTRRCWSKKKANFVVKAGKAGNYANGYTSKKEEK